MNGINTIHTVIPPSFLPMIPSKSALGGEVSRPVAAIASTKAKHSSNGSNEEDTTACLVHLFPGSIIGLSIRQNLITKQT